MSRLAILGGIAVGLIWAVSFTWHLYRPDWLPADLTAPFHAVWHRIRKGGDHATTHPRGTARDA